MHQVNCEKMALNISSTTNEWPQIDDQNLMASTNINGIDKPTQEQIQQQQQLALKCPRCDSSNTKFCYYNNYSLSQPRHFCKACKRYWTRGGTLRNVPVGGGCRKNKRVKRPTTSVAVDSSSNNISSPSTPIMATIKPINNPLFYHALQQNNIMNPNSSEYNVLSFNSRVDAGSHHHMYEYDHQPQMASLGFSTGQMVPSSDSLSKSMLSSYHHLPNFGSFNSSVSAPPAMASFLSSNLQQQKFVPNGVLGDSRAGGSNFLGFSHYEDHMQMQGSHDHNDGISMKELKTEESQNRLNNNQIQQMGSSDPNYSLFWNANGAGSWLDSANSIGSSVPSLI